jgi:hypothetical protein
MELRTNVRGDNFEKIHFKVLAQALVVVDSEAEM